MTLSGRVFSIRPRESPPLPDVDVPDDQDVEEDHHLDEPEEEELVVHDGPREEEDRLHVEDDEEDCDQVVPDREAVVEGFGRRGHAALVRRELRGGGARRPEERHEDENDHRKGACHDGEIQDREISRHVGRLRHTSPFGSKSRPLAAAPRLKTRGFSCSPLRESMIRRHYFPIRPLHQPPPRTFAREATRTRIDSPMPPARPALRGRAARRGAPPPWKSPGRGDLLRDPGRRQETGLTDEARHRESARTERRFDLRKVDPGRDVLLPGSARTSRVTRCSGTLERAR